MGTVDSHSDELLGKDEVPFVVLRRDVASFVEDAIRTLMFFGALWCSVY